MSQHDIQDDNLLYASVLQWAVRVGITLLCLAYGVYFWGGEVLPVPPEQVAARWASSPADQVFSLWPDVQLRALLGWLPQGGLFGIASVSLVCMLVLTIVYACRRQFFFGVLAGLQCSVFLFAMSGAANRLFP